MKKIAFSDKLKRDNRGETIVEVAVSAVIFLIMMGVMQAAVSFCANAQVKSEQIRENTSAICEALQSTEASGSDTAIYSFSQTTGDGKNVGGHAFSLQVLKQTKAVAYTDTEGAQQTVTFQVYGNPGGSGAGGTP